MSGMQCAVYRLYRAGTPLGAEALARQPVRGRLDYSARLPHDQIRLTVFTAYLTDADGNNMLPPLDAAVLLRMDERGILIAGAEIHSRTGGRNSRADHARQAWLIKPEAASDV